MIFKTLISGDKIPMIGLNVSKIDSDSLERVIINALKKGYRHIDCDYYNKNYKNIGNALKKFLKLGICKRSDIFITSKIRKTDENLKDVKNTLELTLRSLQVEYLDLYLFHWPSNIKCRRLKLVENKCKIISNKQDTKSYLEIWSSLEKCVRKKLIRNVGVSNFNSKQIQEILKVGKVRPSVLQVEVHPHCTQEFLKMFCDLNDIVMTTTYITDSADFFEIFADHPNLHSEPQLKIVSQKCRKTVTQVILQFLIGRGVVITIESDSFSRMKECLNVFDFSLSKNDISLIKSYNRNWHIFTPKEIIKNRIFPRDMKDQFFPLGTDERYDI